ncbi:XrtN system VIT domain-containing protein [Larkinella insperata]|uniref:XrtN system VIT domain-containing protein n=1 Tax=Larkinella insperata TaxID=332158 RepID=A0ABW3QFK0_9BACT|nr:XrtN system VIT domain-containing protein [Larkinella insperata]
MDTHFNPPTKADLVSSSPFESINSTSTTPGPINQPPWWWLVFRQPLFGWGLVAVGVSALIFGGYDWYGARNGFAHNFALFVFHYSLATAYTILLLTNKMLRFSRTQPEQGRPARLSMMVLWLMSAYALNRDLPVFHESVPWLQGLLVLAGMALLGVAWLNGLSVRGQQVLLFVLTVVWCLFLYQTIYALPYYPYGFLGLVLLGVGGHIFIPFVLTIGVGSILWQSWRDHEHRQPAITAGLFVPLAIAFWFVHQWTQLDTRIRYTTNAIAARKDDELPVWILLAQQLPNNWITQRYLKTGSVYSQVDDWGNKVFEHQWELKRHDPLVMIATALRKPSKTWDVGGNKLIGMLYNFRHENEERLWSGTDLRTTNVLTQTRIYPEYRLAYTEKTLQVYNGNQYMQQEALYTFHLSPGSVVTSLSLWINGREEKGVLTTKAKADSAYRTIVGVEERDPSVVHWREGNRITVRVFPCMPGQTRQVKIGITSPLRLENESGDVPQLVYENPWFDGPDGRNATETVKLDFSQQPQHPVLSDYLKTGWFEKPLGKHLLRESTYQPRWEIRFDAPALATGGFRFNGHTYQLQPARQNLEAFDPRAIYLDLHQDWTKADIDAVLTMAEKRPVWVYTDELIQLTPGNRDDLIDQLLEQRFSVFPFYRIPDPGSALFVTKGAQTGPQLEDLAGSSYARALSQQRVNQPPVRTFCLSKPSDLVKTLSEFGIFQTDYGSIQELQSLLRQRQFAAPTVANQSTFLPQSGVRIVRRPDGGKTVLEASAAPDHLVRLYAYNHLLNQIGRHYFSPDFRQESLIAEARQAHIVSPLSSLLVLETLQDYDRFKIKKTSDGLGNATLKNTGAVPEPHEWALLLLLALWMGYSWQKRRYAGN